MSFARGQIMRHVIVGTGIAGTLAAETIRKFDPKSPIIILGGEPFFPYCRPMISMLLEGSVAPEEMAIREKEDFLSRDIELLLGESVREVNVLERKLETERGKVIPFDRLLIATGADPVKIQVDGCDLANIFTMRHREDAERMLKALPEVRRVLIVGGGLVGLKAAHALLARGTKVAMVEKLAHPLPLVVDGKSGAAISQRLEEMGVMLKMGVTVASFAGNGFVKEASLDDGSRVRCDLVVVAVGSRPAVSFLGKSFIRVNQGILVDSFLETDAKDIYAAGDVAEATDVVLNRRKVNAVWPVAAEQGIVAGMNMAGKRVVYRGSMGRNVLRIGDLDVLTGGLVNAPPNEGYDVLEDENRRRKTYRKLVFKGNVLKGLVMLNQVEKGGTLLSIIQRQIPVSMEKERLLEPGFDFSQLLPR
jgi:nitrite reductase (NADH) large subunit